MLESHSYTWLKKQKNYYNNYYKIISLLLICLFRLKKIIIKGANLFYDRLKLTYQEHNPTWIHKIMVATWISIQLMIKKQTETFYYVYHKGGQEDSK